MEAGDYRIMQAVGLEPGQCEYTLEIENSQQSALEGLLGRLCQVESRALVNIYQYCFKPSKAAGRTYSVVADAVEDRLSDLSKRRKQDSLAPTSPENLSASAFSCLRVLAVVQEKVSTAQQLGIVGLAEEVIYVTEGTAKVNLLEAVLAETSIPYHKYYIMLSITPLQMINRFCKPCSTD
jgi:hypothetical protein